MPTAHSTTSFGVLGVVGGGRLARLLGVHLLIGMRESSVNVDVGVDTAASVARRGLATEKVVGCVVARGVGLGVVVGRVGMGAGRAFGLGAVVGVVVGRKFSVGVVVGPEVECLGKGCKVGRGGSSFHGFTVVKFTGNSFHGFTVVKFTGKSFHGSSVV